MQYTKSTKTYTYTFSLKNPAFTQYSYAIKFTNYLLTNNAPYPSV